MTGWDQQLEFAYDHGHLYLLDAGRHWSEGGDGIVDLPMPRSENFFVPLRVEGWANRPPPDLDAWDQVVEFGLRVHSGELALASGGCGEVSVRIAPGTYRARWSGRNLCAAAAWQRGDEDDAGAPDSYRLQLWPGPAGAPRAELKRWSSGPARNDLGDLPALLDDGRMEATGTVTATEVTGRGLRMHVRVAAPARRAWERTIRCDGVVRWHAASDPFGYATLYAQHPALLPFVDESGGLSFRGRPDDPERLAHALRAAHAEAAGPHVAFEEVMNDSWDGGLSGLLAVGYGRLASGPATLLRRYARVAEAHGVATRLTVTGPSRNGLTLLELGGSYVIAERFSAR